MPNFDPKTQEVLNWFEKIAAIPRCSKKEEKIRAWLLEWANEHNFESTEDAAGNVLIKVPATAGYENAPILVLQGHMDMVCEKTPDNPHNFDTDPIEFVFDGDWLRANNTTLGADNGIAIAIAMAMSLDPEVEHPPLEILITVDEETGLTGANALEPGFIDGKVLLNIDSEDEGVFTVGCAGGVDSDMTVPVAQEGAPGGMGAYLIKVGGHRGGHSGVDIHEQRGNAIKTLVRCLDALGEKFGVRLSDIKGGSAHNAIPRDAEAVIYMNSGDLDNAKTAINDILAIIIAEIKKVDPDVTISIESTDGNGKVLTADAQKCTIDLLLALPHGVDAYSMVIEGLVETSNNMATVSIDGDNLRVLSSQRSSAVSRLDTLTRRIRAVVEMAGGTSHSGDGYPPWEANWDSQLLAKCKGVYEKRFGKEPVVEVIHAGLECGIIGDKNEGMDMISLGPTLKDPHSPTERLFVPDIRKIWDFLADLYVSYK